MGRKSINIERIQRKIPREYAFVQRKRGLIKKAIELAILCDKELFFASSFMTQKIRGCANTPVMKISMPPKSTK